MRYAFLLAVSLVVLACATPGAGRAQQEVEDWPYLLILSGPATARPGADATYVVTYQRVDANTIYSSHFVFTWPPEAASLTSSRVVSGPAGGMTDQIPGQSVNWGFPRSASEGAVEFVLRIDPGFTGDLRVSIYVRGSGIRLPEGSVTEVTTVVTPAGEFPTTGAGGELNKPGWPPLALGLGAALALAGTALLGSAVACQRRSYP